MVAGVQRRLRGRSRRSICCQMMHDRASSHRTRTPSSPSCTTNRSGAGRCRSSTASPGSAVQRRSRDSAARCAGRARRTPSPCCRRGGLRVAAVTALSSGPSARNIVRLGFQHTPPKPSSSSWLALRGLMAVPAVMRLASTAYSAHPRSLPTNRGELMDRPFDHFVSTSLVSALSVTSSSNGAETSLNLDHRSSS